MEYYIPPPDPDAERYHQYRYAAGFPVRTLNESVVLDPTSVNEEDYPNFEGDHDIPNFDDESSPAPMGSEGPQNDYSLSSQAKGDTVYKKAPGAPKRFKSSYVHFFTDFVERAKKQLGPDGLPLKFDLSTVSKESSHAWKSLSSDQRKYWNYISEQEASIICRLC